MQESGGGGGGLRLRQDLATLSTTQFEALDTGAGAADGHTVTLGRCAGERGPLLLAQLYMIGTGGLR